MRPGIPDDFWFRFMDQSIHLLLPTIALSVISIATYARYTRASLGEVLNQEWVRTARAKGLSEPLVVFRHVFRNALLPITTIVPLDLAGLLGSAMIIEVIFSLRGGLSGIFLSSIFHSTNQGVTFVIFPLFSGYLLVIGLVLAIANLIVDLVYTALDPRIRVSH
jgi:peptide/nickel transport system permease protein